MNKELEALERIGNIYTEHDNRVSTECDEDFGIIETALKEKETPTETFEQFVGEPSEVIYKKLKALEILKSKDKVIGTDIFVEEKRIANNITFYDISDKECELLKEVLK